MMLIDRLELLLDSTFIHYGADCYQWALDSEIELNSLDEDHRKEVLVYHRGDDYKTKALVLVNQEYRSSLKEKNLSEISLADIERGWYLVNRITPKDPLGLIYGWFTSHAALYIPDRFDHAIRKLDAKTKTEALDVLFKEFMTWAEQNDHLRILSFKAGDTAYIDEIEGLFKMTVKTLTTKNNYLMKLFQGLGAGERMPYGRRSTDSPEQLDRIDKNAQGM